MNNKKGFASLIVLLIASIVLSALVIGYVIGKNVANNSHVQAAVQQSAVKNHSRSVASAPTLHYEFYPFFTVLNRCSVQQPIRKPVHIHMNVVRTNVQDNVQEEDNSNNDIVTNTATPTPVITIIVTPTPIITTVPAPTSTPMPDTNHCNNGLGNGPDCPPQGHDKNNDGIADDSKGNNDDDESTLPCGDRGNPCNKNGKKDIMLPSFIIVWLIRLLNKNGYSVSKMSNKHYNHNNIGNPLLDSLMQHTLDISQCINDCSKCVDNCVDDKKLLEWQCNNQ